MNLSPNKVFTCNCAWSLSTSLIVTQVWLSGLQGRCSKSQNGKARSHRHYWRTSWADRKHHTVTGKLQRQAAVMEMVGRKTKKTVGTRQPTLSCALFLYKKWKWRWTKQALGGNRTQSRDLCYKQKTTSYFRFLKQHYHGHYSSLVNVSKTCSSVSSGIHEILETASYLTLRRCL